MRLILSMSLAILCTCVIAQESSIEFSTDAEAVKKWRIGLALHNDNGQSNPYHRTGILILPRVRRTNGALLVADYQIWRARPALRLSAEVGYYDISAGNNELRWLDINRWSRQSFVEHVQMNYVHLGFGFLIEPFPRRQFSPYLGWQVQFAFPDQLQYSYEDFAGTSLSPQDQYEITGGERVNRGWKLHLGIRMQLSPRWTTSFGYYHAYMDFWADWPPLERRQFLDAIMRLDVGGIALKCLYAI